MTPLDIRELRRGLPPEAVPEVRGVTGSTIADLAALAAGGAPEYTLLAAAEQTAGRGRRGRAFFSPADSGAYFSLLLRPPEAGFSAARVTAAAAVAAAEACEALFGARAGIKWVNDVYVGGRKAAGILAEAFSGGDFYVVLGIGANISPPEGAFPDSLPRAGAMTLSPPPFARERYIAETVRRFLPLYKDPGGEGLLERYRARSVLTGRRVTIEAAGETYGAEALGIDSDYRLLARRDGGATEALFYGEVSLHLENVIED
jgi:BirA family biotin operon repressor/biotin-[acetyl-CoA-carboxylase] ligase